MKGKREADNNFNFKSEKLDELRSRVDAAFDEHGDEAWEQIKGIFTHPKRLLVAALAAVRGGEDAAVLDAVRTERERQVAAQLTPPAIAEKLDENKILRFVRSEAFDRICGAEEVLRELAFITSLPAAEVMAAQGRALPEGDSAADAGVLVQGIADIVLVYPDHLELLDYKTDRRKTRADFVRAYRAQLELYAKAIDKRFAPRRVTYKGIYSLELGELIEV